ncbi:amino acid permease [Patescibacteria group bacterium]
MEKKKTSPLTNPKNAKILGVFALAMINVSLICSLRGLPTMAEYGMQIVFFLGITVLVFLLPVSFVSAELAAAWPKRGGIYSWVKEAFGERWGFITQVLQWVQNLVFYPTALAATAAVIAYLFNPALAENPLYNLIVIIVIYWAAIFVNLRGMKTSSRIATVGTILGIIIPGAILVILGFLWVLSGQELAIPITLGSLVPDLGNVNNIIFLSGLFLFFAGMEVSGVHAKEVKNPQKDYPKAIFISAIIVTIIFLLGALSIAFIIPASEISLTAGIMQTYQTVLAKFNLLWLLPVIVLLAAPGMIVQVSSWIAGPSRGLLVTAKNGDLPPFLQKINKHGMPINIMLVQGVLVTVIALVFLVSPSVSSSFWILTALAALLYLTVYLIMFAAAIKLRKSRPDVPRPYKVPGGKYGMWIFAGIGIVACVFAMAFGLFPPHGLKTGSTFGYILFLIIGFIVMFGIPLVIWHFRKPSWKPKVKFSESIEETHDQSS